MPYLLAIKIMILMNINYDAEASSRLIPAISTSSSTTKTTFDYQNFQNDVHQIVNLNRDQYPSVELDLDKDYNDEEWNKNALDRGPFFELSGAKNITAIAGHSAYLNCRVRNLGNKTISWIRHRDLHLLTVGKETYTPDQRFQSVHNPHTNDWSLKVLYPQQKDSGIYECQISTTPPVGYSVMFSVVEPITTILGMPEVYIDSSSTVNLTCIVNGLNEPPTSILWTHNGYEINYDSPRGGVSVITEKSDITTSYLLIQRARPADSGKYICSPSHANSAGITVHVLNSEHPAAIQGANRIKTQLFLLCLTILICALSSTKRYFPH